MSARRIPPASAPQTPMTAATLRVVGASVIEKLRHGEGQYFQQAVGASADTTSTLSRRRSRNPSSAARPGLVSSTWLTLGGALTNNTTFTLTAASGGLGEHAGLRTAPRRLSPASARAVLRRRLRRLTAGILDSVSATAGPYGLGIHVDRRQQLRRSRPGACARNTASGRSARRARARAAPCVRTSGTAQDQVFAYVYLPSTSSRRWPATTNGLPDVGRQYGAYVMASRRATLCHSGAKAAGRAQLDLRH